ncbi:hypothetical protein AX16_002918 [Volvariella volvacea WC 439]|nr:hypothetical protein AX16_002918 [Volvariella volvacea WC 439]
MSSMNALNGWSQSGNTEIHDMPEHPQHPALRILTQHPTSPTTNTATSIDPVKLSSSTPSSPHDYNSPPSDASSSSNHSLPELGTLSDHDSEQHDAQQSIKQEDEHIPKRGDPAWVARPRNPFIIFRCEYSQTHCREGKRIRRPPGAPPEKSLSKRAAEAWYVLPEEEKMKYKELADIEREEHAKMYPQYRFRPAKRGMKTRRATALQEQQEQLPQYTEPMYADQGTDGSQELSDRSAVPLNPPPFDQSLATGTGEPALISPLTLPSQVGHGHGHGVPPPAVGGTMPHLGGQPRADLIRANRRRSCSQPIPLPRHLCAPGSWRGPPPPATTAIAAPQPLVQPSPTVPMINVSVTAEVDAVPRPEFKRSRSATGSWSLPLARHGMYSHGNGTPYEVRRSLILIAPTQLTSGDFQHIYTSGPASPQTGSISPINTHFSLYGATQRSFGSSSSSLANWNGEVDDSLVPSPSVQSASSASSSPWMTMASLNISSSASGSPISSPRQHHPTDYMNSLFVSGEPISPIYGAETEHGMQGIYTLSGIGEENIGDFMTPNDMLQCSEMTGPYDMMNASDFNTANMFDINPTTTRLDCQHSGNAAAPSTAVPSDPGFVQCGQYGPNDEDSIPLDLDKYLHSF